MILDTIIKVFENNCDERGIPNLSNKQFISLSETYDKQDIKDSLANYICKNNIPFPTKIISKERLTELFLKFRNKSMLDYYIKSEHVNERFDYKYSYYNNPLGVLNVVHTYNDVSDFFQQENRMKCGSNSSTSPFSTWKNELLLSKMNWHFWRKGVMGNSDFDDAAFRSGFRLGSYTATQFKPNVAKALYEKHNAKYVLDTSCGWGDRLAGFYATKNTKKYVGCDPNPDVFETYKKQCIFYEECLGHSAYITVKDNYFKCEGSKTVEIWNLPSEDVDWSLYENQFDFYFTSPPYFETEKYAEDSDKVENQSWNRYDTFDKWKYDFFFDVTKKVWITLKSDAFMMINIIEPRGRSNSRFKLCDDMVDFFSTFDDSYYIGKIGMRMSLRPNLMKKDIPEIFIEPIWIFRKGNNNYLQEEKSTTLENFFK